MITQVPETKIWTKRVEFFFYQNVEWESYPDTKLNEQTKTIKDSYVFLPNANLEKGEQVLYKTSHFIARRNHWVFVKSDGKKTLYRVEAVYNGGEITTFDILYLKDNSSNRIF